MRITLDYYRILRVPIKAEASAITQAYEDLLQQISRQEYSQAAISARNRLLEKAYKVLSNSQSRAEYDRTFLAPLTAQTPKEEAAQEETEATPDSNVLTAPAPIEPCLEVEPQLVPGVLIVLCELAEYHSAIELGKECLYSSDSDLATKETYKADVLLCMAMAHMELGREQWQKQQWEEAAISGKMGLSLLQDDGLDLFPSLQGEIMHDLNRLKPYRVLDLLKNHSFTSSSRRKGIELLQSMLAQRRNLPETAKDPSGLKIDQFLHFIQQIRNYLTLSEQKEIFLTEAKRGSHISSYVAAYALIADGYANKQPMAIVEAQGLFEKMSQSQNTHWERAICALLLGQAEESQEIIQHSQDRKTIEAIEQDSRNAPDLLPGLCFYGEQWLQKEVLSQFKDLKNQKMTLREYFSDSKVQSYLEQIVPTPQGTTATTAPTPQPKPKSKSEGGFAEIFQSIFDKKQTAQRTATQARSGINNSSSSGVTSSPSNGNKTKIKHHNSPQTTSNQTAVSVKSPPKNHHNGTATRQAIANSTATPARQRPKTTQRQKSRITPKVMFRSALLLLGLIFGIGTLAFVVTKKGLDRTQVAVEELPVAEPEPIITEEPPVTEPVATPETVTISTELDAELAQKVVQTWLDSKAAALGQQHDLSQLSQILTGELATTWSDRANYYKQSNSYRQFTHGLTIRSVKLDPNDSNRGTVEAEVKEAAQHYQGGQQISQQSYDENLLVRYQLVRQGDLWKIEASEVVQGL